VADDARMTREFKMDMVIANPDPLGLFGFAFATFLGNAATLGLYGATSGQLIFECMFLGGFVQLIAGLQDYKNRNLFGATAFTGFGFFWIAFGVVSWLSYVHLVGPADGATIGWHHLLWVLFVFALVGTSFALTKFLTATVIFVDAGLVLIALGAFSSIDAATKLGAASLVISALLALYTGWRRCGTSPSGGRCCRSTRGRALNAHRGRLGCDPAKTWRTRAS
jgi:succinate-acetate transporter protein